MYEHRSFILYMDCKEKKKERFFPLSNYRHRNCLSYEYLLSFDHPNSYSINVNIFYISASPFGHFSVLLEVSKVSKVSNENKKLKYSSLFDFSYMYFVCIMGCRLTIFFQTSKINVANLIKDYH